MSSLPFSLKQTFECGQCFRWQSNIDGSYSGVVDNSYITINYGNLNILYDYLDLDRDYAAIQQKLANGDDVMQAAIMACGGIHILKQDKWETLISFIISQNNNITRISHCIEILCERFGTPIGTYDDKERFAFPTPQQIIDGANNDKATGDRTSNDDSNDGSNGLSVCHLGYRERYIVDAARRVLAEGMPDAHGERAHEWLMSLNGVGPKVAACIELFGYADFSVFPIDVWMRRAMHKLYSFDEADVSGMQTYAREHWGQYAGLAQQYLFYYMRSAKRPGH
jgi:N-glycosylase/DNA lyase